MWMIPARLRPMITRIAAADDAQRLHVVGDGPAGEGGRDAEQREDGAEPCDERDGVLDGRPARRPVDRAVGRDGDRRELAEVGGHQRQHAGREEGDQARRHRHEERVVGHRAGAPSRTSSRRRRKRGRAGGQLQLAVTQGDHRDREGVAALPAPRRCRYRARRSAGPGGRATRDRRAAGPASRGRRRTGGSRPGGRGTGRGGERSRLQIVRGRRDSTRGRTTTPRGFPRQP